jgi:hypothetical protein
VLIAIAVSITVVLVGGSLIAIHTQSQGYRTSTTAGYAALADRVGLASTRTGSQLSTLMAGASALTNSAFPETARGILEEGLDVAVQDTSEQAQQAQNLQSPPPEGGLGPRFTRVMTLRASATAALRTTIDRLLGMQPLPVAGGATPPSTPSTTTQISSEQAAAEMAAEGLTFERSDALFRALQSSARSQHLPFRLHPSVWVPAPTATAPLGSATLGATAAALASSPALVAFHHLVVTAVGFSPPAVPTGGVGTVSTDCIAPVSTVPGTAPTVLPPTGVLTALVTVTNCGNVPESDVTVTLTVTPADTPGASGPPATARGGRSTATVDMISGASAAPSLAPLPVAGGHTYTVTVAVTLPPGQADPAGSTQQFLVQVA